MELKRKKKLPIKECGYELIIETMTGDADDYHKFSLFFDDDDSEELKKHIIACEVLKKTNGRNGYGGPYFDLINDDDWFTNDFGILDSFYDYEVIWNDGEGASYEVGIKLNAKEKKEIVENDASYNYEEEYGTDYDNDGLSDEDY